MSFRLRIAWPGLFFHLPEFSKKIVDDLTLSGVHGNLLLSSVGCFGAALDEHMATPHLPINAWAIKGGDQRRGDQQPGERPMPPAARS
jgi:hypothetical protein